MVVGEEWMASRHCPCGEGLREELERLVCPRCGPTRAWLVRMDGEAVAAGSNDELYLSPALLVTQLDITEKVLKN